MGDKVNITGSVKGHLVVKGRTEGGKWFTLVDQKNALVMNAKTIVAKALAGEVGWKIDSIKAIKNNAVLATGATTVSFPSPEMVEFQTLFGLAAFNDTIDELRLSSVVGEVLIGYLIKGTHHR